MGRAPFFGACSIYVVLCSNLARSAVLSKLRSNVRRYHHVPSHGRFPGPCPISNTDRYAAVFRENVATLYGTGPRERKKNLTFRFFSATFSKLLCVVNVRIVKLSTIPNRQVWEDQTQRFYPRCPAPYFPSRKRPWDNRKPDLLHMNGLGYGFVAERSAGYFPPLPKYSRSAWIFRQENPPR